MEPRMSLVTPNVDDLARSTGVHRRWLGTEPSSASRESVSSFADGHLRAS